VRAACERVTTERLLRDRMISGDEKEIGYVAALIGALPGAALEDHMALIASVLQLAQVAGATCLERVEATLRNALVPTRWESVVGQPDPNQVKALTQAARLAESLPVDSPERRLFGAVAASIERTITSTAKRDEEWLDE
jgi:hypothetical protein